MTRRGPRHPRAHEPDLAEAELDTRCRTPLPFTGAHELPLTPVSALPRPTADCCLVSTERRISLGRTVMVLHRHEPDCRFGGLFVRRAFVLGFVTNAIAQWGPGRISRVLASMQAYLPGQRYLGSLTV